MTKYRLNIKYPIEKEHLEIAYNLRVWKPENTIEDTITQLHCSGYSTVNFKDIPKSWLEEIEESDFEKWLDNLTHGYANYSGKMPTNDAIPYLRNCWKVSEKNTHELYKSLMDKISSAHIESGMVYAINNDDIFPKNFMDAFTEIIKEANRINGSEEQT